METEEEGESKQYTQHDAIRKNRSERERDRERERERANERARYIYMLEFVIDAVNIYE